MGGVPCSCKADGARRRTPRPPEACPAVDTPPLRRLASRPPQALSLQSCALQAALCPWSVGWPATGKRALARQSQHLVPSLPQRPCPGACSLPTGQVPGGQQLLPLVTGLSGEQGGAGVQSRCSERRGQAGIRHLSRGGLRGGRHLPPEGQLPQGCGSLPASPYTSRDVGVRVRRTGHVHLGEQLSPG